MSEIKTTVSVAQYNSAYRKAHGVRPRGIDLTQWTQAELAQGIRVLSGMLKGVK